MKLIVQGKGINLTDDVINYAEKRFATAERYFENIQEANLIISKERGLFKSEVTISMSGTVIRGESKTQDIYASIDDVLDKIKRQIKKYKESFVERRRETKKFLDKAETSTSETVVEDIPKIVKVKKFVLKPMDEEEAIMQMELLGHTFFVFLNSNTDKINVVYKRNDGNYGLIEPE
ncbi:MAG: ribosome-associated translation inhibitor RaiA [Caldisericia bacterium]|nr:ribosome-associated translation inhibitor RaiA [Caldisericia bacterium]